MRLELPWPPSNNHYWRHANGRHFIGQKGRDFRADALAAVIQSPRPSGRPMGPDFPDERLSVRIDVHPPDRRRRDLDNIPKSVLDALEHALVFKDDSQIDLLTIERGEPVKGGKVIVTIEEVLSK